MKIFIIGATGLIGLEVAKILLKDNHQITTLVLDEVSKEEEIPKDLNIVYGSYLNISDEKLNNLFDGVDSFIFAAGIDERIESSAPIYELFKKYNNDPLKRLLKIAKNKGVKDVVVLGSYFTYFNELYKDLELAKNHPYIRSRVEQKELAFSFADDNFNVSVVELPYIFGVQKGRKPVWVFLAEIIKKMKLFTFYSKGGTTMITKRQAAEAVVGALYKNKGANSYPIGYYNYTYKELLTIANKAMGYKRKIIIVPNFIFKLGLRVMARNKRKRNLEGGLDLVKYAKMQTKHLYIDKSLSSSYLGVKEDDIDKAIFDSFKLSNEIINNKDKDVVEMKI